MLTDADKEALAIDRGVKAERLLKDSLLAEAFDMLRAELSRKWEQSPARDHEGREYLFLMIKATNDVRGYLEQAVRAGKVALHSREQRRLFDIFKGKRKHG